MPLVYSNVLVRDWRAWHRLRVHEIYGVSSFHSRVKLDYPVSMGGYSCARDPTEPIVLHLVHVPSVSGIDDPRAALRAARRLLLERRFEDYESAIRTDLSRMLGPGGFDAGRDVLAITVNRWSHGYSWGWPRPAKLSWVVHLRNPGRRRRVDEQKHRQTCMIEADRQAGMPGPRWPTRGPHQAGRSRPFGVPTAGRPSRQKLVLDPELETRTTRVPRRRECLQTTFESLGLGAELVHSLAEQGYTEPTALQGETIQNVLAGRNVLALAGDGTGRTLAYGLPVLQRLRDTATPDGGPAPRALFLMPTRELAARAEDILRGYAQRLELTGVLIQGGVDYAAQVEILQHGVDAVVATTGRLLDHVAKGTIDLSRVQIFAIDAADRLTDIRFQRDVHRLLEALPAERQTLLFATTVSDEIRAFAADLFRIP